MNGNDSPSIPTPPSFDEIPPLSDEEARKIKEKVVRNIERPAFMPSIRIVQLAATVATVTKKTLSFLHKLVHEIASLVARETAPLFLPVRDWQMDFDLEGQAGETKTISIPSQCYFRGEKMLATDDSAKPGMGTRIVRVLIGNKLQMPIGSGGTLTMFFANNALGNGMKWDTCPPGLSVSIAVEFLQSCKWTATVFGKAVH